MTWLPQYRFLFFCLILCCWPVRHYRWFPNWLPARPWGGLSARRLPLRRFVEMCSCRLGGCLKGKIGACFRLTIFWGWVCSLFDSLMFGLNFQLMCWSNWQTQYRTGPWNAQNRVFPKTILYWCSCPIRAKRRKHSLHSKSDSPTYCNLSIPHWF